MCSNQVEWLSAKKRDREKEDEEQRVGGLKNNVKPGIIMVGCKILIFRTKTIYIQKNRKIVLLKKCLESSILLIRLSSYSNLPFSMILNS